MRTAAAASLPALVEHRLGLDVTRPEQLELAEACARARAEPPSTPEAFLQRLAAAPDEHPDWRRLVATLAIGETYFFRDRACFEALERQVLPSIVARRRGTGELCLRVWSAGCATGEEAYSIAILLHRLLPDRSRWRLSILATDVNRDALDSARRGVYRKWALRDTSPEIREQYFGRSRAGRFELDPEIRAMVTFAPLNLARDRYPATPGDRSGMDVILCRNVLMYFTADARRATVSGLARALGHEGWLAVSAVEGSPELLFPLVPVKFGDAILYRKVANPRMGATPTAAPPRRVDARLAPPRQIVLDQVARRA